MTSRASNAATHWTTDDSTSLNDERFRPPKNSGPLLNPTEYMNNAKQTAFKASGRVMSNWPITSATISEPATPPRLKPLIFTFPRAHPRNNAAKRAISGADFRMCFSSSIC